MSKWTGLPDIDTSGSEVFETADQPDNFVHDDDTDLSDSDAPRPTSQDILADRLDVHAARDKFKGSRLHGADFSLQKKKRTQVYAILPRGYSTEANGEQGLEREDAEAKLKRLRFEMEELELELEGETQDKRPEPGIPAAAALLGQLRLLKTDLSKLSDRPAPEPTPIAQSPTPDTEPNAKSLPPPSLPELASQLTALETLIGPSALTSMDSMPSSFTSIVPSPVPLAATLTKLEGQLQLLTQPRHFDTLGRRIKNIVTDLERIHETRRKLGDNTPLNTALNSGLVVSVPGDGGPAPLAAPDDASASTLPPDIVPRLQSLFALVPRLNALAPLTPTLLLRLRSLAALHSSASTFEARLSEATKQCATLSDSAQAMEGVLASLQKSLETNEGVIKANLKAVEERVGQLAGRIADLQTR